jgi:site-specific DNA-methyltransferase (adenine-specific)
MQILQGDCLPIMQNMPSASVDGIFCDPPYGTTQCSWDEIIPLNELWPVLKRIRKPGAPIVFTACMPFTAVLVASNIKEFRHHWVWEKNKASGHLNANRAPLRAHEDTIVFCDRQPLYQPQMTEGHKPGNFANRTGFTPVYGSQKPTTYGGSTSRYPRTVQRFPVMNNDDPGKFHPTQKPVEWFEYLLRTYSSPGDLILDFACGSGTTGAAALATGRNFIGIELDETFAAKAAARLSAIPKTHYSQQDVFA